MTGLSQWFLSFLAILLLNLLLCLGPLSCCMTQFSFHCKANCTVSCIFKEIHYFDSFCPACFPLSHCSKLNFKLFRNSLITLSRLMGNSTRFVSRSAKEQLIYFFNHILAHNTLEVTEGVLSFFFFYSDCISHILFERWLFITSLEKTKCQENRSTVGKKSTEK